LPGEDPGSYHLSLLLSQGKAWRIEWEQVPSHLPPLPCLLLLPRFGWADVLFSEALRRWRPFDEHPEHRQLTGPLIRLSWLCGRLLRRSRELPEALRLRCALRQRALWVVGAEAAPPGEAAEVLSAAWHQEILPPQPSPLMTGIITSCSSHLFAYFQRLDPSLRRRNFIETVEGRPWINLSALLDMMTAWGLPSSLVCSLIGAEDIYRVRLRPWQALRKLPVYYRVLREQFSVAARARRWVRDSYHILRIEAEGRQELWQTLPEIAFNNLLTQMQALYVELVSLMQALTGALALPVKLLDRLGWLSALPPSHETARYLQAYEQLLRGEASRASFLRRYGSRGLYESDLGAARFAERKEAEWAAPSPAGPRFAPARRPLPRRLFGLALLPLARLLRVREWLRHHAMEFFYLQRLELQEQCRNRFDADFSRFSPEELARKFAGEPAEAAAAPTGDGWTEASRFHPPLPGGARPHAPAWRSLGVNSGIVRGRIWRVGAGDLPLPPIGGAPLILVADTLDPGWAPFLTQVQGVAVHAGGLLSQAALTLQETGLPALIQLPRLPLWQTGDWAELDGAAGTLKCIAGHEMSGHVGKG
jgi:pyruvate,water dikinase